MTNRQTNRNLTLKAVFEKRAKKFKFFSSELFLIPQKVSIIVSLSLQPSQSNLERRKHNSPETALENPFQYNMIRRNKIFPVNTNKKINIDFPFVLFSPSRYPVEVKSQHMRRFAQARCNGNLKLFYLRNAIKIKDIRTRGTRFIAYD